METAQVNGLNAGNEVVPKIVESVKSADDKIVTFVQQRPVVALCAAVALGYVVGRVFSRFG